MKNDNFLLRLTDDNDCDKLIKVNSDQNALPFSNSEYETEGVLISVFYYSAYALIARLSQSYY